MSDPFAELADDVHAEEGFFKRALYRAGGAGAGEPVTIRRLNPDSQVSYRGQDFRIETDGIFVRCSQVVELKQDDTFELLNAAEQPTGKILKASEDGRRDDGHYEWWVGIEEVA
jgi:hypothetical protein